MPYDYAVLQSAHMATDTVIRAVALTSPCRYFATRDAAGWITLPTLDPGARYIELQGIQNLDPGQTDVNRTIRMLGDQGFQDSRKTGTGWGAAVQMFLMKDAEIPAGQNCPVFRGGYEEGFDLIQRTGRGGGDLELYLEILLELGPMNGSSGNWIYDYTGVNVAIQNIKPGTNPEDLTQISFDMVGRGRFIHGLLDAGASQIPFGSLQTGLLTTSPSTGTRRFAVVPADNASAIVATANLTVTYTTDGTTPMTQLALGAPNGAGFRLENASTGAQIPCTVTISANVVTIDPVPTLAAATIFRLVARDGAVTQAVDSAGNPSASGVRRALQGFSISFRTA
jgi:hypothetical protein